MLFRTHGVLDLVEVKQFFTLKPRMASSQCHDQLKVMAMSTFSPDGSRSSNGMRKCVCVPRVCVCVRNELEVLPSGDAQQAERPTREHGSVLFYVHGNHKAREDGQPKTATSTFTQLLNYELVSTTLAYIIYIYIHIIISSFLHSSGAV